MDNVYEPKVRNPEIGNAMWSQPGNGSKLMSWLPGTHELEEVVLVPADVPAARYTLDVAILSQDGKTAHVELGIAGKRPDKWYPVSYVKIKNEARH